MISQRIQNVTPSATSMLGGKISEMKAAGLDVASFNLGEPDFQTPQKIMDACTKAMLDGRKRRCHASNYVCQLVDVQDR